MPSSSSASSELTHSVVSAVEFGLFSPEEIARMSVCRVQEPTMYVQNLPASQGVNDHRMGSVDRRLACGTCRRSVHDCSGHFGHIKFEFPVYHVGFLDLTLKILKTVCFFCSALLISDANRLQLKRGGGARERKKRISMAAAFAKTRRTCPSCGGCSPAYTRNGLTIRADFSKVTFSDPDEAAYCQRPFTSSEARIILQNISEKDAALLGFDGPASRPELLVMTALVVPPPIIRPSVVISEGSKARGQDDLTSKLCDIVKANNAVRVLLEKEAGAIPTAGLSLAAQQAVADLTFHVATLMNNDIRGLRPSYQRSGLPSKSITARLKGKDGRVRGSLMGFSSRRQGFSAQHLPYTKGCLQFSAMPPIIHKGKWSLLDADASVRKCAGENSSASGKKSDNGRSVPSTSVVNQRTEETTMEPQEFDDNNDSSSGDEESLDTLDGIEEETEEENESGEEQTLRGNHRHDRFPWENADRKQLNTIANRMRTALIAKGLPKHDTMVIVNSLRKHKFPPLTNPQGEPVLAVFRDWLSFGNETRRAVMVEQFCSAVPVHNDLAEYLRAWQPMQDFDKIRYRVFKRQAHWQRLFYSSTLRLLKIVEPHTELSTAGSHLSLKTAIDFCWEDNGIEASARTRLALVKETGYTDTEALDAEFNRVKKQASEYAELRKSMISASAEMKDSGFFEGYRLLSDSGLGVGDLQGLTDDDIKCRFLKISPPVHPAPFKIFHVLRRILLYNKRESLVNVLTAGVDISWSRISAFKWLSMQNKWYAESILRVIDELVSDAKTYYKAKYRKTAENKVGRTLLFLHKYVERLRNDKTIPESDVPPIQWAVENCDLSFFTNVIIETARSATYHPDKHRSSNNCHSHQTALFAVTIVYKRGVQCLIGDRLDLDAIKNRKCLKRIQNERTEEDEECRKNRRMLTSEEFECMLNLVNRDSRWTLILLILREVGLRLTALSHLRYGAVLTDNHEPRSVARVPEKGQRYREFPVTPNIQRALKVRSDCLRQDCQVTAQSFILGDDDLSKPYSGRKIQDGIKRLALAAGIRDVDVHPHLFRHSLVGTLLEAGNSMETVSKFMGHRQVQTTHEYYFIAKADELDKMMINPFTGSFQRHIATEQTGEAQIQELNDRLDSAAQYIMDQHNALKMAAARGMSAQEAIELMTARLPDVREFLRAALDVSTVCETASHTMGLAPASQPSSSQIVSPPVDDAQMPPPKKKFKR